MGSEMCIRDSSGDIQTSVASSPTAAASDARDLGMRRQPTPEWAKQTYEDYRPYDVPVAYPEYQLWGVAASVAAVSAVPDASAASADLPRTRSDDDGDDDGDADAEGCSIWF